MTAGFSSAIPGHYRGMDPGFRASHADRELAADILRIAAGDGRLGVAELEERLEIALTARTISELIALTVDLPGGRMLQATSHAPADSDTARVIEAVFKAAPEPIETSREPGDLTASRWAFLQSVLSTPRSSP